MAEHTYRIVGHVHDRTTHQGVAGLRVEAWDKDLICHDLVGSAVTDASGVFHIEFSTSYFRELFLDRRPDLFFRVFHQNTLIASTEDSVLWNVAAGETAVVIEVDVPSTPEPERFVVKGKVLQPDLSSQAPPKPLSNVIVRAFHQYIRREEALGRAVTNAEGHYEIFYSAAQFQQGQEKCAEVLVRVFLGADQSNTPIAQSSLHRHPLPVEEMEDLLIPANTAGMPAEYDRLLRALERLLADLTVTDIPTPTLIDKLADLKDQDIAFLIGCTDIDRQRLEYLVSAARLQQYTQAQGFDVSAAIFYSFAREGLALDLLALYRQGAQQQRAALEQAIEDNIIPASFRQSLAQVLENLQHLLARHALLTKPAAESHTLRELLTQSALPPEKHASLLNLYVSHDGTIEEFWQKLPDHPDFREPGLVQNIQFTLQLGILTRNHIPLIQALRERYQPASTRKLVELDTTAWTALVRQVGVPSDIPGETPAEKAQNFVDGIVSTLQITFPTETVAQIVVKAPDIKLDEPMRTAVSQFYHNVSVLADDPDATKVFDIRSVRVDEYVTNNAAVAFDGIPETDRANVVSEIKRQQRALRLSTGPETMTALLGSRFDSAHAIASIPRATFVDHMQHQLAGEHQAHMIYDKAQHINTTNLLLYTQIRDASVGVYPQVMAPASPANAIAGNGASSRALLVPTNSLLDQVSQKNSPTLAELFGSLDLCDCEHCRSVLGPAAYLVDAMHLLENSKPYKKTAPDDKNQEGKVPLDLLLARRPDLAYLRLTCENTNTTIPYIDLVNEILESYVALGHLDQTTAKDTGDSTAAELSANPQYVEDTAYNKLKQAVYPLPMPYNRYVDTARVYLDHLGSSRARVMQAFQKVPTPPTAPTPLQSAIDAESLQLLPEDHEVLTGLKFDGTTSSLPLNLEVLYGADAFAPAKLPKLEALQPGKPKPPAAAVLALQRALKTIGTSPALQPNGEYDSATVTAVTTFQSSHGLPANGVVDLATWTALRQALPTLWQLCLTQVPALLAHTDGMAYTDLIALVQTRFLNPNYLQGEALEIFEKIPFSYATLAALVQSNFAALNTDPALQQALKDAGLTPQQLIDWSHAHFQQVQKLIVLASPNSTCDLDVTTLQHFDGTSLTDEELRKLHRFIRLWHKLGWSIPEVDKTLTALQATDITPTVLQQLAQIKRLQTDLKIPLVRLLSLWASIDTYGEKSLYTTLFQNKAVLTPVDADFRLEVKHTELALAAAAYNPVTNTFDVAKLPKMADTLAPNRVATILAALRLRAADLELIRADANLTGGGPYLILRHLSVLYRYSVLARALRLQVKDLIALKQLSGINPFSDLVFDPLHPDSQHPFGRFEHIVPDRTQRFVDIVRKVQRSGFSVAQLNYLFRHQWEPGQHLAPAPAAVALLVKNLQDGLKKIAQENLPAPDPTGELTHAKLATIFEPAVADQVVQMINGSFVYTTKLANPPTSYIQKLWMRVKAAYPG